MKNGRVKLMEIIFKEEGMFVSYSPELDLSSCGKTETEARKNLIEATTLFLEEAQRMGTLEDILTEQGFTLEDQDNKLWIPPEIVKTDELEVSLPAGA